MDALYPAGSLRASASFDDYGDFYPAGVDEDVISVLTERYLRQPSAKERILTKVYLHFQLIPPPPSPAPQGSSQSGPASFHWQAPYPLGSEEAEEAPVRRPVEALIELGLQSWIRPNANLTLPADGAAIPPPPQLPAQWIDCNLKTFDFSIIGKFDVIVADPPWDIHMSLPYGTMSDDDMRAMPFPMLQDEGLLFLWVTGRAMELARELLTFWGYTRIDELIWVKVGQTQRLIRTGRTGHWLNHTKEHCLVAAKISSHALASAYESTISTTAAASSATRLNAGASPGIDPSHLVPSWLHSTAGLATDVIVSEVRDTSRKPDELYGIIEKLCPGGRKVELFGRKQNVRRGWLTLGNQLKDDRVYDPVLRERLAAWRNTQGRRS
ncbi:methyltransferase [Tilletia horrida]|nr:methyltransferase [Tilletia horrida]